MSSTDKRAAGVSYCALLMVVIFEGVAIIAALVAITGTFWLGAPSFFSRPTLPPSFADPDFLPPLVGADPARHREGFCAPRRQERGLWRVCYTNPEMPNLLDANTTLEEAMASSETFGLSTVVALGARDAAATDRVASDAPRRAGAPQPRRRSKRQRHQVRRGYPRRPRGQPSLLAKVCEGVHWRRATLRRHLGPRLPDKMHATRALTLVFIFCGALKVVYVLLGKCAAARGGGFGYLTLVQVLSGWADGWSTCGSSSTSPTRTRRAETPSPPGSRSISTRPTTCRAAGHSFWLFLAARQPPR